MRIQRFDADRQSLLPLFYLADDSKLQVASYVDRGEVLAALDGDDVVGYIQIVSDDDQGALELKSMAVRKDRQGQGIGRALVAEAVLRCRAQAGRRIIVSTATADIGNLRFYQRQGFRMYRIVRDAFGPAKGYPDGIMIDGIPLRDQVFLELFLPEARLTATPC
jgi:ribosomal protein S18 acetylase RimI-like enzyme